MTEIRMDGVGRSVVGWLGWCWGLGGILICLGFAIFRLAATSVRAFEYPFNGYHWFLLIATVLFMAYAEGYKGFQKSFAPRVAARAAHLKDAPQLIHILLAPVFCMGFYHTTRRRLISAYVLTVSIVLFVVAFQYLSQPWRGLLDAGVVVGLTWGVISLVIYGVQAVALAKFPFSPELPTPPPAANPS